MRGGGKPGDRSGSFSEAVYWAYEVRKAGPLFSNWRQHISLRRFLNSAT